MEIDPADVPIGGTCREEFQAVRDAFAENFARRGEIGAAVCLVVHGRVVVDLFGGWTDEARTRPWRSDTLVNYYSVGKAVVALLALRLVDAGLIDLDAPIAAVWPEFAQHAKQGVTLRQALCHRAGVPAIRERLTNDDLWDWNRITSALASTEPWWEPGTRHGSHTNTYGHLIGEVVHRITGELPGSQLRRLAEPLQADVWCGLGESEQRRCADVIWAPTAALGTQTLDSLSGEALMLASGYFNPPGFSSQGVVNTSPWRSAQIPSTNGHGSASGVARLYANLIGDQGLLSPSLLAEATRPQSQGFCPFLGEDATFGLGFKPTIARRPFGPNPRSFGHFGTGGAVGFGDPDAGVAFGYVMNHVIPRWQSSRNRALIDAAYASVASAPS